MTKVRTQHCEECGQPIWALDLDYPEDEEPVLCQDCYTNSHQDRFDILPKKKGNHYDS